MVLMDGDCIITWGTYVGLHLIPLIVWGTLVIMAWRFGRVLGCLHAELSLLRQQLAKFIATKDNE